MAPATSPVEPLGREDAPGGAGSGALSCRTSIGATTWLRGSRSYALSMTGAAQFPRRSALRAALALGAASAVGVTLTGSMGGFGALLLASDLGPARVTGVVAASAALWRTGAETPAGAYDDREDFDRHSIFGRVDRLAGIPVRLDCGRSDPFVAANRALAEQLPGVEAHFDAGGHEDAWWRTHAAAEMAWLAARA